MKCLIVMVALFFHLSALSLMGQGTSLPYSKDGTGIIASVAMNEFTSNLSYIELIIGGQPTSFSFDFTDEISGAVYLLGNAQVDYSVTYSASIYSGGTSYGQETEEINGSYSSYGDYFDFGGGTIQPTQVNYDVGFSSQSSPQYWSVKQFVYMSTRDNYFSTIDMWYTAPDDYVYRQ